MIQLRKVLREIEVEVGAIYEAGVMAWADHTHDNAFSKALSRFDQAVTEAYENKAWQYGIQEAEHYKATAIDLIKRFKSAKGVNEAVSFLAYLREQGASQPSVQEPLPLS